MKTSQYKRFISLFLSFFFLFSCMVVLFNYSIDPNRRYRFSVPENELRRLARSPNLVLTLPDNYDDRALITKFVRATMPPEIVVIGGSRVLNIEAEMFRVPFDQKILNAAMMAGTIRDYVAIWQMLKQVDFKPKMVFICVEEQSINSYSQNDRYLSIYEYYNSFFQGGASIRRQLMGLMTNFKDLLSLQTTLGSIKLVLKPQNDTARIEARSNRDQTRHSKAPSFSMIYPTTYEQRAFDFIDTWGRKNGLGEVKVFEMWNRADRRGYDHLSALLKDIKKRGGKPILIGMPYHPEAYNLINQSKKAYGNMLYFVNELKRMADEENIPFYDAIVQHHGDFNNKDFMDGVHLRMTANHRLFRAADRTYGLNVVAESFQPEAPGPTTIRK